MGIVATRVIEVVRRRVGYVGLEPDHEKDFGSFTNGQDVLESLTTGSGKFECWYNRYRDSLTDFLSGILSPFMFGSSEADNLSNNMPQ